MDKKIRIIVLLIIAIMFSVFITIGIIYINLGDSKSSNNQKSFQFIVSECKDSDSFSPGINSISWSNKDVCEIKASVVINCAYYIQGGGYFFNNSSKNYVISCTVYHNKSYGVFCLCQYDLTYIISNIESNSDFEFEIEWLEIPKEYLQL